MTLGDKLRKMRLERGQSIQAFARELTISGETLRMLERGRQPKAQTVVKIAAVLHKEPRALHEPGPVYRLRRGVLGERLANLSMSKCWVASQVGVSNMMVTLWGKGQPIKREHLRKLCELFGASAEELAYEVDFYAEAGYNVKA